MGNKNWTVYMHTSPSGKKYIGITSQKTTKRWRFGKGYKNSAFQNAIKKYGWINIAHDILFEGLTKQEAENKEIELIAFYRTNQKKYGYNIQNGGNCLGTHSTETRNKISKALKNKPKSKEAVENLRNALLKYYKENPNANKGRVVSEETRMKIRIANKGHKLTPEQKIKQSLALKGEKNPMYNKHHTLEARKKMSLNYTKKVKVKRLSDNKVYDSILDASKDNGVSRTAISNCLKGITKHSANSKWEYVK